MDTRSRVCIDKKSFDRSTIMKLVSIIFSEVIVFVSSVPDAKIEEMIKKLFRIEQNWQTSAWQLIWEIDYSF